MKFRSKQWRYVVWFLVGLLLCCLLWWSRHTWLPENQPLPSASVAAAEPSANPQRVTSSRITTTNRSHLRGHPVRVSRARSMPLHTSVTAIGTLKAQRSTQIVPEITGHISKLYFTAGQHVAQGALLVQLDDAKYRADVLAAQSALRLSRADYLRFKKLEPSGAVSAQQLQQVQSQYQQQQAQLQAAQAALKETQLRAPFAGYVTTQMVSAGSYVDKGTVITSLIDRDDLLAEYSLPEKYRDQVALGQAVRIKSMLQETASEQSNQPAAVTERRSDQGRYIKAKVSYIAPQIDPTNLSITMQAQLIAVKRATSSPDPMPLMTPGAPVEVKQQIAQQQHAVVVPQSSILPTLEGMLVYRVVNARAVATSVTIGARHKHWVQIEDGLQLGDIVINGGLDQIRNGMLLRVLHQKK